MPGWQRFYQTHRRDGFELIAVAVEHGGPEAARRLVEAAGVGFPTAFDGHGTLGRLFDFKVVPNGVLVDEAGVVRWAKFGGFSFEHRDDVAAVERFLAGDDPGPSPEPRRPYALGPVERELVSTKLRLGEVLAGTGRRAEAVATWRDALRLDPENFTIRKQIWAAEHPERFFPEIDLAWQGEQLAAEREREIAAGICDPDGCPLPWAGGGDAKRGEDAARAPSPQPKGSSPR